MKKTLALLMALSMLLATGCQNNETEYSDPTITQVTNADGEPDTTTTTASLADDIVQAEEHTPPAPPASTEGLTEYYISYTSELDKDGNPIFLTVNTYDEYGNLIEQVRNEGEDMDTVKLYYNSDNLVTKEMYYSGGRLSVYHEYSYDENGNKTSYRTYNPDGTVNYEKYTLNYDAKFNSGGREVERKLYQSEDEYTVTTTEYNEAGDIVRSKCISYDGMLLTLQQSEYDDKGRITLNSYQNTLEPDNSYSFTYTYTDIATGGYTEKMTYSGTDIILDYKTYDADGNLVEHYIYDENGVLYCKHVYEYQYNGTGEYQVSVTTTDINGKVISQTATSYAEDGAITESSRIEYTYDDDGTRHMTSTVMSYLQTADAGNYKQIIEKVDGEFLSEQITRYDDNGYISEITTVLSGTTNEEIYERDADGNITKITRYVDGEVIGTLVNEYIRIEGAWHPIDHVIYDN